MSEPIYYPCFRYHPNHEPTIFQNQEELDAAGDGWVDTPEKFGQKVVEVVEQTTSPVSEPEADESIPDELIEAYPFPLEESTNRELREYIKTEFDVTPKGKNKPELIEEIRSLYLRTPGEADKE